jgi:hypothetical protein
MEMIADIFTKLYLGKVLLNIDQRWLTQLRKVLKVIVFKDQQVVT